MGNKKFLVSLLLVYISIQHVSTLEFFLAELDFTRIENEGLTNPIIISKESSNAEEVVVRLSLFTFAEYDAAGLPAPTTPLPTQRPDPAENEPGPTGRRDFNGNPIDIVFPPSSGNVDMNIAGILIDDEINEAQEGLIVRIEIMTIGQADMQQLRNSTRDTALIRIVDNDDIRIGFSVSTLLVSEGEGLVTGRVSIGIENGVITEQEPAVSVVFNQAVALPGMDYNIVAPINSTLVFSASVRNIDVQVQVIDDQLFESAENFNGQVSIPQNAVSGLRLGSNGNLIVTIADNEVIEVGFLRDVYRVSEANGSVTVQYAVLTPADVNLLSPTVFLQMTVTVINGTAFENMHFGVSRITTPTLFSILTSMTSATAMFSTTDDAEPNPNREFSVMLTRLGDNFNLTVPVARVIIEDNDGGGQVEINILPSPQLEVIEGSDVNISCGPLTLPDPIRLLANGVDVSTPLSFEDVAEQRVFQFGAANRSDNGTVFQCASGSLLSNETLLVVFYPPLYTGQATHEVIEGQEFRIMLQLIGNPLPLVDTITWTFNGQPLNIDGGINFGLDFIEFSSINRTNDGNYTVTSSNLAGNASFALSISVFYPPLYTGQATHEVIEGQEFRIMLQLTGNPLPLVDTITWTFNGQPLSIGGGINFGLDFIEFSSINRTNEGNYTVTSSNLAGNASFALSISVFYPPLYTGQATHEVIEGQEFRIMLQLTGNPLPLVDTITWTFNGQPLSIGGGINFGLDFIEFSSINRTNEGNYTVTSSNLAGNASFALSISVFYPPLYTGQATHEVIEGQEFRIMLQLTGNPLPLVDTVTWTFNGQPLSIGGGINFGLDFIEFSSINRTNEGNYTVTSSNLAGNASFALSISVFYPPLYTGQATHEVIEGQEFRIMLQLTGNPLPLVDTVTWTFNGQPLSIGGGINFDLDFIEFSSINRTNEGNYTVTSSNLAGNASFALSISVFYPPEYTIASVFTVREGDPFIPQIGLQGNPLPLENDTEWSLNGRLLVIMPGISFGADFINIQMVTRLDQGNYTVNSSNVAGFGSDTFTLIVETSTGVAGPGTTETMPTAVSTTGAGQGGLGGDPHFSIILPTGQLLCFSVQGEHNFTFNLMSNAILNINARFDQDSKRKEVTWIGSLGIVIKSSKRSTKIRFEASTKSVHLNDKVTLSAKNIDKVTVDGMKVKISEASKKKKQIFSDVDVELVQAGVRFTVRFTRGHLDMRWQKIGWQLLKSHGIVGQFIKNGVEVDETRFLLHLPNMDPVPVMRKPVWHFMERETPEDQLCWVAMNPGYQGKGLIEGHYLDYLVDDVLSSKFKFKEGKYKKLMKYFLK